MFIDYFEKNPQRITILDEVWAELEARPGSKIYTSQITTVEVSHIANEKLNQTLDPNATNELDAFWFNNPLVEVVEVHRKVAQLARDLVRQNIPNQWALKPADAIHLATAQFLRQPRGVQECHTYEKRWVRYDVLIGMTICEPYAQKPLLPLVI